MEYEGQRKNRLCPGSAGIPAGELYKNTFTPAGMPALPGLCFRRFGLQRILRKPDQLTEGGGIGRRQVGDDLAVESHFGGFEPFHEAGVCNARRTRGGIDPNLPQSAEVTLLGLAVAERILAA